MHETNANGELSFKCDFCLSPWTDDRPMVEGHRGSLICGPCLKVAYREVLVDKTGRDRPADASCRLCLSPRDLPYWFGPVDDVAIACRACIAKSARILARDDETDWSLPDGASADDLDGD